MILKRIILIQCLWLLAYTSVEAKTIYDTVNSNIFDFFRAGNSKYIIRNIHQFTDTLIIPDGCELFFDGGRLSGPIKFSKTKLSGRVNLKGSSISGSVRNKQFDASWLCAMDGVTDDANSINEMIEVCDNVFFPKGKYRLISAYNAEGKLSKEYLSSVKAHIGITRCDITLKGEDGAEFVTEQPMGTICLFSQPKHIENSIGNILIDGILFTVLNDGKTFYEFMHTIKLIGVNGLVVKNCRFNDFWGDAICLSHFGDTPQTGERTRNQNVKILNNVIVGGEKHNNRNGISVISGKNVIIKNNIIKNTSRKDMPGGVDIEPNNSVYTVDRIKILNNSFEGITTSAIQIYIPEKAPAHDILIKRNVIKYCGNGVVVVINSNNTTDGFKILSNKIDEKTRPYIFIGKGSSSNWQIKDNVFGQPCLQDIPGNIKVTNLLVKNNKKKD